MSGFVGWIVEESLESKNVMDMTKIIKTHEVTNNEPSYPGKWHIHHVSVRRELLHHVTEALQSGLKDKWYAHFVDEGHMLVIVFRRKVFFLDRKNPKSWEKAFQYGRDHGVNPVFFEDMPVDYKA